MKQAWNAYAVCATKLEALKTELKEACGYRGNPIKAPRALKKRLNAGIVTAEAEAESAMVAAEDVERRVMAAQEEKEREAAEQKSHGGPPNGKPDEEGTFGGGSLTQDLEEEIDKDQEIRRQMAESIAAKAKRNAKANQGEAQPRARAEESGTAAEDGTAQPQGKAKEDGTGQPQGGTAAEDATCEVVGTVLDETQQPVDMTLVCAALVPFVTTAEDATAQPQVEAQEDGTGQPTGGTAADVAVGMKPLDEADPNWTDAQATL